MNPQTYTSQETARLSPGGPGRAALDELGNLFFSRQAPQTAPALPTADQARHDLDEFLAGPPTDETPDEPPIEVLALLAGGLAAERRTVLARAAARRLVIPDCSAAVVTFESGRAAIQTFGDSGGDSTERDPAAALRRLLADGRKLILVIAERACSFLGAGRRLPEHCVVLVTPDAGSVLEAYRELKTAVAATTGPVPEVFVFDATSNAAAEQTYRRVARVAIAHLGCTPTFAGRHLEPLAAGHPLCRAPQTIIEDADAGRVYEALRRHIVSAAADVPPAPGSPGAPGFAVELQEPEPAGGGRQTLTPVAGVLKLEAAQPAVRPSRGVFTPWQPESSEDLLAAVVTSLQGLVPGARGLAAQPGTGPDGLAQVVGAPERPDVLASDAAGRPVAVLLAADGDAAVLQRALATKRWVELYAALLARAFPQSGLDAATAGARCIVLVPDAALDGLAQLCPREVELTSYTCVSHAGMRGLMFRAAGPAASGLAAAGLPNGARPSGPVLGTGGDGRPEAAEKPASESAPVAPQKAPVARASAPRGVRAAWPSESTLTPCPISATDEPVERGTSPDDDLSADEINELRSHFEIDELT